MGNVYGYIRVSSKDQNEDRQVITMHKMQVPVENIYIDKQSGKDFNRPQYRRLLRRVKADDLIYIKSIDRLGRNYTEILNQWKIITKDKHANLYIMDTPILDTRNKGTLLKIFISDLVLTLLSYIAENERTNIHKGKQKVLQQQRPEEFTLEDVLIRYLKTFMKSTSNGKGREYRCQKLQINVECHKLPSLKRRGHTKNPRYQMKHEFGIVYFNE